MRLHVPYITCTCRCLTPFCDTVDPSCCIAFSFSRCCIYFLGWNSNFQTKLFFFWFAVNWKPSVQRKTIFSRFLSISLVTFPSQIHLQHAVQARIMCRHLRSRLITKNPKPQLRFRAKVTTNYSADKGACILCEACLGFTWTRYDMKGWGREASIYTTVVLVSSLKNFPLEWIEGMKE